MTMSITTPTSVTRSELYELIWAEPMTKVAPRFGLSDVGLAKLCSRFDIPRPPVGYWAQKQFGKAPERTPLPAVAVGSIDTIEFAKHEDLQPVAAKSAADHVTDTELKRLIVLEEQPENLIAVSESSAKLHPFVRDTKAALTEKYHRQGLCSPTWNTEGARLDIQVAKESVPRALRIMDALIKAFEKRGHKVVAESREYGRNVWFVILGEQFSFRLREKTKMVRVPAAEVKSSFDRKVTYVPTGCLELQLHRKQTGYSESIWKDGKRAKLEDQLNDVMVGIIIAVESERNYRRQQEEYEKRRREDEAKRWKLEQDRRNHEQKVNELSRMVQNWDQASRIRAFMADVKVTVAQSKGQIQEGSELAEWITWALKHADAIDPLGVHRTVQDSDNVDGDWSRPKQPR